MAGTDLVQLKNIHSWINVQHTTTESGQRSPVGFKICNSLAVQD